jgi:hypothetical protein
MSPTPPASTDPAGACGTSKFAVNARQLVLRSLLHACCCCSCNKSSAKLSCPVPCLCLEQKPCNSGPHWLADMLFTYDSFRKATLSSTNAEPLISTTLHLPPLRCTPL